MLRWTIVIVLLAACTADDVPALGAALRVGVAVSILVAMSLPGPARAQADTEAAPVILLHPRVPTILQLPDEIEQARVRDREELSVAFFGDRLYVRPRPGTPAGMEALLEVQTRTLRRTFRLRVVRRARDANLDILVLPAQQEQDREEPTPEIPPVPPTEEALAASVLASATCPLVPPVVPEPAPAPPAPVAGRDIAPTTGRAATAANAPRFEVSVHAVATLAGTTELKVAGYQSIQARQPHRAFGGRVAVRPRDARWAVEASVTGEWPVAPTTHTVREGDAVNKVEVNGPLLRMDVGLRGNFGTRLSPTVYGGAGLQAHHRDVNAPDNATKGALGDMPFRGVLALGMGLEYRTGGILLGLELHVRQGVLDGYRSVGALLSVGFPVDWGE